jgi:hypothetical protein
MHLLYFFGLCSLLYSSLYRTLNIFVLLQFQLTDLQTEFEQDKFDMQKQHTKNIQEILDDTNARLQKMEREYSQQTASTVSFSQILYK